MGTDMLEVRLLGQFEVLRDGRRLTIPTRNSQSLFAYLVLNAGKGHRRERLAGLLWPDSSEENARSNLRHELWRLRKALETAGESYLLADDLTITFNPHSEDSLDVQMLERTPLEGSTAEDLIEALSSYSGELLPGFYDEWISLERDRLIALYEAKMTRLLEILQSEGRWTEVLDWGTRWIALGGWPEPAYRALMSAYANTGDLSKAGATYERYAQGLKKELGIKPSEQTQALYKRLKAGWKTDTPAQALPRAIQPPISILEKTAPSSTFPNVRRSNLPRPLTSFIGREKEIEDVKRLVSTARLVTITGPGGVGKTRLAIQVAEAVIPQFKDSVWWVGLASLFKTTLSKNRELSHQQDLPISPAQDEGVLIGAELVAQAVAKTLRIPESPGLPLLEGVLEHLLDKQLLLVLDNCEHLIEACATLVESLLINCPKVIILATSREALGVPGEKACSLPSLSLPEMTPAIDTSHIYQSEAVSLFIERVADVLPGYKPDPGEVCTIGQICLRLDGIPLAIELAAARMNLLSAQEIAARLDSRFSLLTGGRRTALPRHQTLLAAIEWSFDLLSDLEQVLFRRLSFFAGSFTLEAAEAICAGQEISSDEVLTLLGRLVDKSLLIVEPIPQDADLATRYRFLDTIRSFGRLKLNEAKETMEMAKRHSDYYLHLVEAAGRERSLDTLRSFGRLELAEAEHSKSMGKQQIEYPLHLAEDSKSELSLYNQIRWIKLLQAENDNIRAVIEGTTESEQAEGALKLVEALLWIWYYYGSPHEGLDLALKALNSPLSFQYKEARARALNTAGFLQVMLGDLTSARQSLEEAQLILRVSDDEASLAWSMQFLGMVYTFQREYTLADAALKEGSRIARKLGDRYINSFSFYQGDIDLQRGDRSKAKQFYEESANFQRAYGNKAFLAYPLRRLGYMALEQNDIPNAWKYFSESLVLNREVVDKPGVAACLTSMVVLAMHMNRPDIAVRLLGVVERRLELISTNLLILDQAELERIRSQLEALRDEASFKIAFSEGWELSEEQTLELVEELFRGKDQPLT